MVEAFKHILNILGTLGLIILAIGVITIITPIAFLWKTYVSITQENRKIREIIIGTADFFLAIASSLDKLGNCAFGGFFNNLLLKDGIYKFGNNHETVSEVLGWAYSFNDLNANGLLLYNFLNYIDKNHCQKAKDFGIQRAKDKLRISRRIKI